MFLRLEINGVVPPYYHQSGTPDNTKYVAVSVPAWKDGKVVEMIRRKSVVNGVLYETTLFEERHLVIVNTLARINAFDTLAVESCHDVLSVGEITLSLVGGKASYIGGSQFPWELKDKIDAYYAKEGLKHADGNPGWAALSTHAWMWPLFPISSLYEGLVMCVDVDEWGIYWFNHGTVVQSSLMLFYSMIEKRGKIDSNLIPFFRQQGEAYERAAECIADEIARKYIKTMITG